MIYEHLATGAGNPTTGRELAVMFNCTIRDIQKQIERERRQGKPICANGTGYFRAANQEELQQFCGWLNKRAGELQKTRRLLLQVLQQLPDKWGHYQDTSETK